MTGPRPLGFTLLAIYLAITAVAGLPSLTSGVAEQGMAALPPVIAVFAAVAAEALWHCRAWCVRAFVAYCCVHLLLPMAGVIGIVEAIEPLASFVILAFVAAIVGGYVHNRAGRLFASPTRHVPVPAPHP